MAVDPERSVLTGIEERNSIFVNLGVGEVVHKQFAIDWDEIPGTQVQVIATTFVDIAGVLDVTYRLRRSTSLALGATLLGGPVVESVGPARAVTVSSAVIAKPTGLETIQFTQDGGSGGQQAEYQTTNIGIILQTNGVAWLFGDMSQVFTSNTANELFMFEYSVDWDRFPAGNVRAVWCGNGFNTNFGTTTERIRNGGSYHGINGTQIATASLALFANSLFSFGGNFARPSGRGSIQRTTADGGGGTHEYREGTLLVVPV